MATLDAKSDAIVIRIVYDGAPFAGKTTCVRALANGLGGKVQTPEEVGGRTLYFDWLDYTGGLFEGHRIRCQIISVPGQTSLASRRRYLLNTADVVVFVADTTAFGLATGRSYLEGLRAVLHEVVGPRVGIVMQANKRDAIGAVPLPELRKILEGARLDVAVIESVATEGSGVREAFVFAVRLALDRVRELMRTNTLLRGRADIDDADELLAHMRVAEGGALDLAGTSDLANDIRLHDVLPTSAQFSPVQAAAHASPASPQSILTAPTAPQSIAAIALHQVLEESTATPIAGGLLAASGSTSVPLLPHDQIASGMIWPPVGGRIILNDATASGLKPTRLLDGAWREATDQRWIINSFSEDSFTDIEQGRTALLTWARKHAGAANLLSTHRCVALAPDGHGKFRLWQIVRKKLSLRIHLEAAFAGSAAEIATTLLKTAQQLTAAQDAWSKMEPLLAVTLDSVGMDEARCCYIGLMPASATGTVGANVTATEPALDHQAVLAQKTAIVAEIDTQRRSSRAHEYSDASYSFALRLLGSYA